MNKPLNECVFDSTRRYRYLLIHRWDELFPRRVVVWVCLNPARADEIFFDNTYRRIKAFTLAWGFNEFRIVNLFAYRAIDPRELSKVIDPIGPENDDWIDLTVKNAQRVVAAWGVGGQLLNRAEKVLALLKQTPELYYLRLTKAGFPAHPLYLPLKTQPQKF